MTDARWQARSERRSQSRVMPAADLAGDTTARSAERLLIYDVYAE
jgi:hypothetical protein